MSTRAASISEPVSEVSSIASDPSSHDGLIQIQQFGGVHNGFDLLQGSSDSSHDGDPGQSQASGLSRYYDALSEAEDAAEIDSDELSIEQFREHLRSPSPATGSGLVAVTPIALPHARRHSALQSTLQSPLTPTPARTAAGTAATSSYMFSPQTPRQRRGPRAVAPPPGQPPPERPERPLADSEIEEVAAAYDAPLRGPVPPPPPPSLRAPSLHAQRVRTHRARASVQSSVSSGGGLLPLQLGQPRQPSESRSLQSQGSRVSDEGHIEPERRVQQQPLSYLKRSGRAAHSRGQYLAGLPRLPSLPTATCSGDFELAKRDVWGRRQASPRTAWLVLALCAAFPPLWLLISAGYFDGVCGVFPRPAKLAALALALVVFAAVIALVIVFAIVRT